MTSIAEICFFLVFSFTSVGHGDLVILHELGIDESFRDPPAFQTDDLAGRGVSNSDPTKFINPIGLGQLPSQFISDVFPDRMIAADEKPILDFEITAGRRARFGGGALLWSTTGDMNPLVSNRGLERVKDDSVQLRFWNQGDSFTTGSPVLNQFDAEFLGTNGFSSGAITTLPEFVFSLNNDIPLGIAPSKGAVLGQVVLTASGRSPNPSSGTWKTDTYVTLITKNPELKSLQQTRSQVDPQWSDNGYAIARYEEFLETLQPTDPVRLELSMQAVRDKWNINNKGCLVTSLAMALDALDLANFTPDQVHAALDNNGGFTEAGTYKGLSTNGVPRFSGMLLDWGRTRELFGVHVQFQDNPEAIAAAIGTGLPVAVGIDGGRHFVLATGARQIGNGPLEFFINNPAPNVGPPDQQWTAWDSLSAPVGRILSDEPIAGVTLKYNSPLSLTVTAPDGRSISFDSASGITASDFADAYFQTDVPIVPPDELEIGELPDFLPQELGGTLFLPDFLAGDFQVEVTGIDDGPFSITLDASNGNNSATRLLATSGVIQLGQSMSYTVTVVPEPSTSLLVLLVTIPFGLVARQSRSLLS